MPSAYQGETPGTDPSLTAFKRNQPCLCIDFELLASINLRLFFFKPPGGLPCHSKLIVTSMIVIQSISCLTLCNPMKCSMPGFPVPHYVLKFAQTHVQWVSDAIQPFRPLSPPSPPSLNLSQHQGLFQWDNFTSSGQYDFKKEERG